MQSILCIFGLIAGLLWLTTTAILPPKPWEDTPEGRIHLFRSEPGSPNRENFDKNQANPGVPWWAEQLRNRHYNEWPYCRASTDTNQCFLVTRMNEYNSLHADAWLYNNKCEQIAFQPDLPVPSQGGKTFVWPEKTLPGRLETYFWGYLYPPSMAYKQITWGFPEAESYVFNGDHTTRLPDALDPVHGYWPTYRMSTLIPFNCKE